MNLQDLASIAEIIGGFAVLATLVYLTIELRDNTKILKANTNAEVYRNWSVQNDILSQHPHLDIITRGYVADEAWGNFEPTEQAILQTTGRSLIQRFQAIHYQYSAGIVDKEVWQQNSTWCHSFIQLPVWKAIWEDEISQPIYSQAFVAAVESAPTMEISVGSIHS